MSICISVLHISTSSNDIEISNMVNNLLLSKCLLGKDALGKKGRPCPSNLLDNMKPNLIGMIYNLNYDN